MPESKPAARATARRAVKAPPKYHTIKQSPWLAGAFEDQGDLKELLGLPSPLKSKATKSLDGRKARIVLATVQDVAGRSRAGIPLHLLDGGGKVVDRAFTSRTGAAVLRFPEAGQPGPSPAEADALAGKVRIFDGSDGGIVEAVTVPAGSQFAELTMVLEELPAAPDDADSGTGLWPPPGTGTDPLSRLPSEFTPELCDAVAARFSEEADSLFADVGKPNDFRSKRTPVIKRLSVVRTGEQVNPRTGELRRYIVRLRQSWVFLGYTLGELAEVDALDPGQLLEDTVSSVERSVEQVDHLVQQAKSFASSQLLDTLKQTNKIDTLLNVATSAQVSAVAGGFGFGIPGLFGGGVVGAHASAKTNATTTTNVNTSLDVTHSLTTAQSHINEAVQSATSTLTSLARTITTKVGRVSPLLSRVTNLLRWRVYENYAVSTTVEDVVELLAEPVFDFDGDGVRDVGPATSPVFTADEIAEYRRFFEPLLLDPALRTAYPALVDGVRTNLSGGERVTHATVELDYATNLATGNLRVEFNGAAAHARLVPGATSTKVTVRFQEPVLATSLTAVKLELTAQAHLPQLPGILSFNVPDAMLAVDVTGVTIWAGTSPGNPPSAELRLPTDALHAVPGAGVASLTASVVIPPKTFDETLDPLWRHVNRNPRYYLGVLAQAAVYYPSLREDCAKLAQLDRRIWQLPILGFEGDRILIARDPLPASAGDVERLLSDPGAATLVQIAAPGTYSEALQGLLELVDAHGLIHPSLLPLPAPVMPPLALVDMAGKRVVPVGESSNGVPLGTLPTQPTGSSSPVTPGGVGAGGAGGPGGLLGGGGPLGGLIGG